MKTITTIAAALTIAASTATAQTPDEVTSWDVLANGKEYTVEGPGAWSDEDSTYLFPKNDFEQTISLDADGEKLTLAHIRETRIEHPQEDDSIAYTIETLRTESVHNVEVNNEYLDYLGTEKGSPKIWFKSLEIVKFGDGIGLHDYNKNQMWILVLPAREPNRNH